MHRTYLCRRATPVQYWSIVGARAACVVSNAIRFPVLTDLMLPLALEYHKKRFYLPSTALQMQAGKQFCNTFKKYALTYIASFFIARQHTDALLTRDIDIANLSVSLSVRLSVNLSVTFRKKQTK